MVKHYNIPVISHIRYVYNGKKTSAKWSTYRDHGGTCPIRVLWEIVCNVYTVQLQSQYKLYV